jgi:hypothetical protein
LAAKLRESRVRCVRLLSLVDELRWRAWRPMAAEKKAEWKKSSEGWSGAFVKVKKR